MTSQHRTFVVGFDASDESRHAVRWAMSVAEDRDRIVVVSAWDIPVTVGYDMATVVDPRDVEQAAVRLLDRLLAEEKDDRLESTTRRGHAGRALVDTAVDADVIVVGHRGRSRMSLMLGSTANYVIHHTERPVVVVRGDDRLAPRKVIVGVDDFDDVDDNPSVRALRWSCRLPGVEEVTALHSWVMPPIAAATFDEQMWGHDEMDRSAQLIAERVVEAAGPGRDDVVITARCARGKGASALIEASHQADLVVVGRRGRGGFAELLLGSTTAEVAAHSRCPVAILR